jgi:predicted oxidoreductase (fatty acid repression mutant protein)
MNLTNRDDVAALQANLHATFDTVHGKEVMKFLEKIGSWYPTVFDSQETNAVIARDANRRLIGTLKTMLTMSPEKIVALTKGTNNG